MGEPSAGKTSTKKRVETLFLVVPMAAVTGFAEESEKCNRNNFRRGGLRGPGCDIYARSRLGAVPADPVLADRLCGNTDYDIVLPLWSGCGGCN